MKRKEEFTDIRNKFRSIIKNYFPDYQDFDQVTILPLIADLASYMQDNLSFYQDSIFNELLIENATDRDVLRRVARSKGYKFKGKTPAIGKLDLSVTVPGDPNDNIYLPNIKLGSILISDIGGIKFTLMEDCNFSEDYDNAEFYEHNDDDGLDYYTITKSVKVIGALKKTINHTVTDTEKYYTITLEDNNKVITEVLNVDENEKWYYVDFLSQDMILMPISMSDNDEYDFDKIDLLQDDKKFTVEKDYDNTKIIFGAGNYSNDVLNQKEFILNPPFGYEIRDEDMNINIFNMLNDTNYGRIPETGTNFLITYYETDGEDTNIPPSAFSEIGSLLISFPNGGTDINYKNYVQNSLIGNSKTGFSTGSDSETTEQLKSAIKTMANSQKRMVTRNDFELATLSLPEKFGKIYKAKALKSTLSVSSITDEGVYNSTLNLNKNLIPTIELYVLGKDSDDKLVVITDEVKANLKKWLSLYRMLTDGIVVRDAYIINIGIKITIDVAPHTVPSQVELETIKFIEDYFDIKNRKIGENVNLSDLTNELFTNVKGIYDIKELTITNKTALDGDYSNYIYDIINATSGNVIGCPDYSIFEIKYPDSDILIKSMK